MGLLDFLLALATAYLVRKKRYDWAVFVGLAMLLLMQMQIVMWLRAIFIDGTLNR